MDKFLIRKETFNELVKSFGLSEETIEKGRGLPPGTIREWKGVKYKKDGSGKWLPVGNGRNPAKEDDVKGDKSSKVTDKVDGMKKETSGNDYSKMSKDELIAAYNNTKDMDERDKIMAAFENADKQKDEKSSEKKTEPKDLAGAEDKEMYDAYQQMVEDEDKAFYESEAKEKKPTVVSAADNYNPNQEVEFNYGGNKLSGKITAKGKDGVTIHDKDDNIYHVNYNAITGTTKNADGTIPADKFNADDYKKSFTDPKATKDANGIKYIYESLGEVGKEAEAHTIEKMESLNKRMQKTGGTDFEYTVDKDRKIYTRERQALHEEIMNKYLSEEKIKAATPENGEKPKFIMFGGRGGSGKSWFTDPERKAGNGWDIKFDENKFIKIDADEIKSFLKPPYEGWNAGEVHEESSHIKKMIQAKAKELGLNIIIDGTMAWSPKGDSNKVRNEMLEFKEAGYSLEAHYMFVPVQESTKRAIFRFAHKNKDETSADYGKYDYKGRLVPMDILLGMQDNEKSFDSVKDICDNWSFSDNQGKEPKLISQKGK